MVSPGEVVELPDATAVIWDLFDRPRSLRDVTGEIADLFDIDPEDAADRAADVLDNLVALGVLVPR